MAAGQGIGLSRWVANPNFYIQWRLAKRGPHINVFHLEDDELPEGFMPAFHAPYLRRFPYQTQWYFYECPICEIFCFKDDLRFSARNRRAAIKEHVCLHLPKCPVCGRTVMDFNSLAVHMESRSCQEWGAARGL
jgi:hypothetical protein